MRLLFTVPQFWPHVWRGSERIVHDLALVMTRRGHEVTVVTQSRGRYTPTQSRDYGFRVQYVPAMGRVYRSLHLEDDVNFAANAAVARLVSGADVANSFYLTDAYGLSLASRVRRRPFIAGIHGLLRSHEWQQHSPWSERMICRALERAWRVTALSRYAAHTVEQSYGVGVLVAHPGTFVDDFVRPRPATERRTVVCTAAVDDPRKRVDVLVAAFLRIAHDLEDVDLLLVGPGDASAVLRRASELDRHAATRVRHRPPPSSPTELPDILAGCTVGALTSHGEAFGMSVVEYLASGMPALVSSDGGATEIITAETGVAVAPGDIEACAEGLVRALELATGPDSVAHCRRRARDFDWSVRGDLYEQLYREAAAR